MASVLETYVVEHDKTIRDAMESLSLSTAGNCIIIDDEQRVIGSMTDGDIRRALLGGATLSTPLLPYVTRELVWVSPEIGRAEVLDIMKARVVSGIPVLDHDQKLLGLHLLREMVGAVERPTWAVIMAGGRGERLRPLTDSIPKPMISVAGRPILERIILHLVGFGIRMVYLAVNYKSKQIEEHFKDGSEFGCSITYLREKSPLGTGGPLSLLPSKPKDPLLVLNADLVTQFDVAKMLSSHERQENAITIGVRDYQHTIPFGVVLTDGGSVSEIHEKPTESWLINAGIYVINPDIVELVPPSTPYLLTELVTHCIERKKSVGSFFIDGDWVDVGRLHQLKMARGETE